MARPSLDEIFGNKQGKQERPSLSEIFGDQPTKTQNPLENMTAEQKAQIAQRNADYTKLYRDYGDTGANMMNYAFRSPSRALGVLGSGLEGFGEGVVVGAERALNGATLGGYDWVDRNYLGGQAQARNEALRQRAEDAGVGGAYTAAELASEIGGASAGAGGAITKALINRGAKGLGLALGDAAIQSGIMGATSTDNIADLPINIAANVAAGTAFGGGLYGGAKLLGYASSLLRSNAKRGMDYLRSNLGDEAADAMIKEAQNSGRSLAEVADDKAIRAIQMARQNTEEAADIVSGNARKIEAASGDKSRALIDETLGNRGGFETVQELEAQAKKEAAPLWEDLNKKGDLAKPAINAMPGDDENLVNIIKNNLKKTSRRDYSILQGIGSQGSGRGYSVTNQKSVNAINAEANGLATAEDIAKELRKYPEFKGVSAADIRGIMTPQEWHHTGKNFKKTNYYDIETLLDENLGKTDLEWLRHSSLQKTKQKDFISRLKDEKGIDLTSAQKAKVAYKIDTGYDMPPMRNSADVEHYALLHFQNKYSELNAAAQAQGMATTSKLANYVKENDLIQREIGKIRKDATLSREVREAADTDFRVLQAVKENIDDQISVAKRQGEDKLVRRLVEQKNELLNRMDEVVPEYKAARQIYEDEKQFERAVDLGKDVFKSSVGVDEFAANTKGLSQNEKQALKLGLRDGLYDIITNAKNETLGWNKILPQKVQAKIRNVLGQTEGNKLINWANREIVRMRNFNKLLQGSQTAEKTALQVGKEILSKPVELATNWLNRGRNIGIADITTRPSANLARETYNQLVAPQGWETIYQALNNPRGVTALNSAMAAYLANAGLK